MFLHAHPWTPFLPKIICLLCNILSQTIDLVSVLRTLTWIVLLAPFAFYAQCLWKHITCTSQVANAIPIRCNHIQLLSDPCTERRKMNRTLHTAQVRVEGEETKTSNKSKYKGKGTLWFLSILELWKSYVILWLGTNFSEEAIRNCSSRDQPQCGVHRFLGYYGNLIFMYYNLEYCSLGRNGRQRRMVWNLSTQ